MGTSAAVLDACVLYPAPLRDVLLELSVEGLFRARWTDQIHDEWIRNLLIKRRDVKLEQLQRTRTLMNQAVPDCLVTGYESLAATLALPDPDDRHVLAAAIVAGAGVVVTFNTSDFPRQVLEPYGLKAQHPDDFLIHQLGLSPEAVCTAMKRLRRRLRNPPMNADDHLDILARQQLPRFADQLRRFRSLI